jgi:hypothetical protein
MVEENLSSELSPKKKLYVSFEKTRGEKRIK